MKKTHNQILWEKEQKRVKQFIRRAEKRGYIFDKENINRILEKPSRVTAKALESLKEQTTPTRLYSKSQHIIGAVETTGEVEVESGLEWRKKERQKASEKAQLTKAINEYTKAVNERAKEKAKEKDKPIVFSKNSVGNVDIIETVRNAILSINPSTGVRVGDYFYFADLSPKIAKLVNFLDERVALAEENGTLYKYLKYLVSVMDSINMGVNGFQYASSEEEIQEVYNNIMLAIKGEPLTPDESKELEELNEESDYYIDYDG